MSLWASSPRHRSSGASVHPRQKRNATCRR